MHNFRYIMKKILLNAILLVIMSCVEADPASVYDFTKFKGKNIDEVNAIIGKPLYVDNPFKNSLEVITNEYHYSHYKKDNIELMIKYNPETLKILSFDLICSKDYSKRGVLKLANLDLNNMHGFSVDDSDEITYTPNLYRGITLIPAN